MTASRVPAPGEVGAVQPARVAGANTGLQPAPHGRAQ